MIEYAKFELARIGGDKDGMQDWINKNILEIIETFAKQGHSGFSAGYAMSVIERLWRYKPLTPLTGEDDEWDDEYGTLQNKRCPSVFKRPDGSAYDIEAVAVSDNGGLTWYNSKECWKDITFPYYPKTHPEYIYIELTDKNEKGYEIITNQPKRIKALYDREKERLDKKEAV